VCWPFFLLCLCDLHSQGNFDLMKSLRFGDCWISHAHGKYMPKRRQPSSAGGNVQKSPSSPVLSRVEGKAAAIPGLRSNFSGVGLTRGASMEYASTAKGRPAYAKPLRQAGNSAGLSAVAAPSPKQLWRVGDLAQAGGFFQHSHLEHSSETCRRHD